MEYKIFLFNDFYGKLFCCASILFMSSRTLNKLKRKSTVTFMFVLFSLGNAINLVEFSKKALS